jgi:hypothetical protein
MPTPIRYAIGDLGPARRHLARILREDLKPSPAVMEEIFNSIERCVERLEAFDQTDTRSIP